MHRIWYHASVFLIRPTPTHDSTLQVILKVSIYWFADPIHGSDLQTTYKLAVLKKRLRELIKLTVFILLLGGMDELFNIVTVLMYPFILWNSLMVRPYVLEFLVNGHSRFVIR